jgi:hypothetical protein
MVKTKPDMKINNGTANCTAVSNTRAVPVTYVRLPTAVNVAVT